GRGRPRRDRPDTLRVPGGAAARRRRAHRLADERGPVDAGRVEHGDRVVRHVRVAIGGRVRRGVGLAVPAGVEADDPAVRALEGGRPVQHVAAGWAPPPPQHHPPAAARGPAPPPPPPPADGGPPPPAPRNTPPARPPRPAPP